MSLVVWEVWSFLQIPLAWYLFRRLANREISGDLLAGALLGVYIEFATEPLWNYHFAINFYKDTPVTVPLQWGLIFSLVVFVSEKLYLWTIRRVQLDPSDRRLLLFDVAAGILIGLPLETLGHKAGIWDYNYALLHWNWGQIPGLRMPYEALVGYALLMLIAPSFVRHWRGTISPIGVKAG